MAVGEAVSSVISSFRKTKRRKTEGDVHDGNDQVIGVTTLYTDLCVNRLSVT